MDIAGYIDHTILKPEATAADIDKLCEEAKTYGFAAVCVNSIYTRRAAENLKGTRVQVATVVGFPLGATTTEEKCFETREAISAGATEIDMVMAIGFFKAGDISYVKKDIESVVKAAEARAVKVIIETCLLTSDEIQKAAKICANAGAKFVKTSTGFSSRGATVEDVRLIRAAVGEECLVKASGGIKTKAQALLMIEAGADRIGTSSGIAIVGG